MLGFYIKSHHPDLILFLTATQYKKDCMVFPYEGTGHLFNVPTGKVAAI